MRAVGAWLVTALALAVFVGGCRSAPLEQRTTQGPTAEAMFKAQVRAANGREPTFDERRHWENELELRIDAYLRAHPEAANSFEVSTFRFLRQAAVGMAKAQVRILLGEPGAVVTDAAGMEKLARRHWPAVKARAPTEAWVYPLGWHLFFAGDRLADITQYLER